MNLTHTIINDQYPSDPFDKNRIKVPLLCAFVVWIVLLHSGFHPLGWLFVSISI